MTNRIMVAAVFLVGCAVGGVSSQLVVPKASAQQAATLTKWEYFCSPPYSREGEARAIEDMNATGTQGWEAFAVRQNSWCFKRPKM